MEPCRVRGERSIQSDGSAYLRSFYGSQSCDVWMPHKLKDHSCERWKHCRLCLTAGELRYSKIKYLGQGHCGDLWQSKVCQITPCQISSWYVDDWASFPRSMGQMGCSCLLSPSAPSSLSWVVMVGADYLQATEKDQAKPSLWDALPSTGWGLLRCRQRMDSCFPGVWESGVSTPAACSLPGSELQHLPLSHFCYLGWLIIITNWLRLTG